MYLLGLDGGETKTHCIIGDEAGNIFAEGFGGPANYQTVGVETTRHSIITAISRALSKLSIKITDITHGIVGLAGVDGENDLKIINQICSSVFNNVPYEIYNDCWLVLRVGSDENWGVVSVCGRGHGCMGRTREGKEVQLRNKVYMIGNRGGGTEVVYEALHHTFRADEGVGPTTRLQEEIPKILGVETMEDVDILIRDHGYSIEGLTQIPFLLSRLAREEDEVAQNIIIENGKAIGKSAASVIKQLNFQHTEVPIVVGGSAFVEDNPLFIDAYRLEVHRVAPHARFTVIDKRPVIGAYYLAIDKFKNK